jgi:peptidoglycan hydrolase-like protein with peptidoglycan-binding domain
MKPTTFSKSLKALLALCMATLILSLSLPQQALADSFKKVSGTVSTTKTISLRKSNSNKSKTLAKLKKNTKLSLIGSKGGWYKVKTSSGKTGYVPGGCVKKVTSYPKLSKGKKGSSVKKLQTRLAELGYLSKGKINSYYNNTTVSAVKAFQKQAKLKQTGVADSTTQKKLYSSSAPKKPSSKKKVVKLDWYKDKSTVNKIFGRRDYAYIVDVKTGTKIKIRRTGGTDHADIEPATKSDTAKLKKIYGGEWSWDRRAVVLEAGGKRVAASINGMPHGQGLSTTNGFNKQQICLHLLNSKTHGSDKVDPDHQDCIEYAYKHG